MRLAASVMACLLCTGMAAALTCTFPNATGYDRTYSQCAELDAGFFLYWNRNSTFIDIALRRVPAGTGTRWIAFGISSGGSDAMTNRDGNNDGANAVIGESTIVPPVQAYRLQATTPNGVLVDTNYPIRNAGYEVGSDGLATTWFTRDYAPLLKRPIYVDGTATDVVYSNGPVVTPGAVTANTFAQHGPRDRGYGTVNFLTGEVTSAPIDPYVRAHATFMGLGWGFFIPVGIMIARFAKHWDPMWFVLHRGIQTIGMFCFTLGYIFAVARLGNGSFPRHRALGTTLVVVGWTQPMGALLRHCCGSKEEGSTGRKVWEFYHMWVGRILTILAVIQIESGLFDVLGDAKEIKPYQIFYNVGLGILCATFIALEIAKCVKPEAFARPPHAHGHAHGHAHATGTAVAADGAAASKPAPPPGGIAMSGSSGALDA